MTGLIYLVIIALWAAVLIPVWLRRHDQISEVRSTARFNSAMKSLGSRPEYAYAFDVEYPAARSAEPEAHVMRPTTRPSYEPARPAVRAFDDREEARRAAAVRRATVLGILTLMLAGVLALALLSTVPRWAPILAAVPVVGFVLATAMTASNRTASRPARPTRNPVERPTAPHVAQAPAVEDDWETWNAWDDDDSWEPVPQTLPTYVSAPRASEIPRPIDKAQPGEWTGSAMVETARAMRRHSAAASAEPVDHGADTAELPAIRVEEPRRRAVNE